MSRRPLVMALAFALLPCAVHAEDLLQTYELARAGDPQYSAAESNRLVVKEGRVQARALLLPQINGSAGYSKSNCFFSATSADSAAARFSSCTSTLK